MDSYITNYTLSKNVTGVGKYHGFHMFLGSYIGGVSVLGTIMNLVVFIGLLRYRKYLDISCTLVMNQALCDLLPPMFCYPLSASSNFNAGWMFGRVTCVYYAFTCSWAGYSSITNLTMLSLERFVTIVFPLRRERLLTRRNITICILIVWLYGFIWAVMPFFGISAYVPEGIGTMCGVAWYGEDLWSLAYHYGLIFMVYVVPIAIIIGCYSKFLSEICKIGSRASALQGQDSDMSVAAKKMERQQTIMVLLMVSFFNIAWFPYALASIVSMSGRKDFLQPVSGSLPMIFAKTSHAANPIIYCLLNKNFRNYIFGKGSKVHPDQSMMESPSED